MARPAELAAPSGPFRSPDPATRPRWVPALAIQAAALARHDSSTRFASVGHALVTGPTGTNVNDLARILVDRAQEV